MLCIFATVFVMANCLPTNTKSGYGADQKTYNYDSYQPHVPQPVSDPRPDDPNHRPIYEQHEIDQVPQPHFPPPISDPTPPPGHRPIYENKGIGFQPHFPDGIHGRPISGILINSFIFSKVLFFIPLFYFNFLYLYVYNLKIQRRHLAIDHRIFHNHIFQMESMEDQ